MIRYGLSKQDGRILFEPQEEQSSILLMTFDQFQKEKKYPHHLVLEKSICTARYCKVEIFAECVQGTICIPKKQEEGKEKLIFGFYLNQEGILLVGDEKRLSALIGKMSQSVRGCMTPRHFLLLLLEFLIAEDVLYLQTIEDRISGFEEKLLEKIVQIGVQYGIIFPSETGEISPVSDKPSDIIEDAGAKRRLKERNPEI